MADQLVPVSVKEQLTHLLAGLNPHGIHGLQNNRIPAEQMMARLRASQSTDADVLTLLPATVHTAEPLLEPEDEVGRAWLDPRRESKLGSVFPRPLYQRS